MFPSEVSVSNEKYCHCHTATTALVRREALNMPLNSKILVINDDTSTRSFVSAGLQQEGFDSLEAGDYVTALKIAKDQLPDAILIDVTANSETLDGLDLCRRFRTFTSVPIIFLANGNDEVDQLLGLAVGADDHLLKPVSPRLLAARVWTILRRTQGSGGYEKEELIIHRGEVHIDKESRTVKVNSSPVLLTRIEFDLLVTLAEKPTRVHSRNQLIESVWGDWSGNSSLLDVHMSRLRKKIVDVGGPRVGYAVRGYGYRYL